MKKNKTLVIGIVLLVAILLVAVGYALIDDITLNISGEANATPDNKNFVVKFTGTPETSGVGTITALLDEEDELKATMKVEGLTANGDIAKAKYTILNDSEDLSAALSAVVNNETNTEYFDVTYNIAESPVEAKGTTTIEVTVELKKTPIDANVQGTFEVEITAKPEQPTVVGP